MEPDVQANNGVVTALVKKERMPGIITATGKVEVNADRIAHVSPRISGKVAAVRASLGDVVGAGQVLATLESVELGEALSRYRQSRTRLSLAKNNMERVKNLVDKKIAARKEILQAETDYRTAETELQTDRERLLLYGVSGAQIDSADGRRLLLPVRSPIGGVVTEKHAIVGELGDPSKSLYTVADLSSVWVLVDINEKELAKVRKGQSAIVTVGAFPDRKFRGRITHVADLVDEATRTVKARVEVQNPGRKLKPEMFATVELTLPPADSARLAVSADAVQELEGNKVVFATRDGRTFLPRAVRLGATSGGMVEVTGGLAEGERYVAKGSFLLKSELKKGELGEEH
jgi:cobalt-zinc-cadmium efflux system membrane fusion protein